MNLLLVSFLLCGAVRAFAPLAGVKVTSVKSGEQVDLGEYLTSDIERRSLFVFGTYAADFNSIEYAQRLRYYLPRLKEEHGVTQFGFLLNCRPDAAIALMEQVDLATDEIDLFVDNEGEAARRWGVERGWLPENKDINPFAKLFGMLWGLGAWATLPAVIGGYLGNPLVPQPWIEDAMAVGQRKGRWPDNALDIAADGAIKNKFSELPLVGDWPRRPLELATLRLQSMLGISLANWKDLAPDKEALDCGVLTQLGGCMVIESSTGETLFKWRDPGICAVANFEDIMSDLKKHPLKSKVRIDTTVENLK